MNEAQQQKFLQAKQLFKKNEWQEASDILEGLVNEVDSQEVGRLTILALYNSEQYTRASAYLLEYLDSMMDNVQDAKIAIRILTQNELFIISRQIINNLPEWQGELMPIIERKENELRQNYHETLQARLREFYHLGDYSLLEQQSRLQASFKLPLAEFVTGAKFLLRDPYTHSLVKSSLIELLCKLGVSDSVTFYWLDQQEYSVIPSKLVPLKEDPLVIEGKRLIAMECGDSNPQVEQLAVQEFQLQVMFLYPRIADVITNINDWIDNLIAKISGKADTAESPISQWQKRLNKMIDELIEKH